MKVCEYKTPKGPTANESKGSGVATIEGDTAIFKSEGTEEECQITLRFTGGKLVVTQTGICGFGHNVSAEGTHKKVVQKNKVRIGLKLRPVARTIGVAIGLWPVQELVSRGRPTGPWLQLAP